MQSLSRSELRRLLGLRSPGAPVWKVVREHVQDGLRIQSLTLGSERLPAVALVPLEVQPGGVAVLYCHAHGNAYDIGKSEVLEGRPALRDPPLALALAKAGTSVICVDMPGFGDRQSEGGESALSKAAHWRGETLLGQMISDQLLALDVLIKMTNPSRIGAVGISMGGTLAYAVAASRDDISAVAHLCVFSDIAPLIDTGAHDLHGPYMTIPGLLPKYDMSHIASLIAPRDQLVATGEQDPLTPESAYVPAISTLKKAFGDHSSKLTVLRDASAGHFETPAMRRAVLDLIARHAAYVTHGEAE